MEGIYDEYGLQFWRLESIPEDATLFIRSREETCLLASLILPDSSDEEDEAGEEKQQMHYEETSWASVAQAREARRALEVAAGDVRVASQRKPRTRRPRLDPSLLQGEGNFTILTRARAQGGSVAILTQLRKYQSNRNLQITGLRMLCELTLRGTEGVLPTVVELVRYLVFVVEHWNAQKQKEDQVEDQLDHEISFYTVWCFGNVMSSLVQCHDRALETQVYEVLRRLLTTKGVSKRILKYGFMTLFAAARDQESHFLDCFDDLEFIRVITLELQDQIYGELEITQYILWILDIALADERVHVDAEQKQQLFLYADVLRTEFYHHERVQQGAVDLIKKVRE